MSKAWETDQKGNDLLVLLAMCDFASDEGVLFPSLNTLSKKAKVAKSTLSYILKAYEEIGVITRTQRKRENQSDTSTSYVINHLNIDYDKYKKAYQKARKYTSTSSQCEHPETEEKVHNVNTQIHNVNTQSENCEHLEPSILNHQDINHHKKNTKKSLNHKPKDLINFYKENISNLRAKVQEMNSVNAIALVQNDIDLILIGLTNYAKALPDDETFIKALPNFVRNKIYLDYQEEVIKISSKKATVPSELVGKKYCIGGEDIEFKEDGYLKIEKNWMVTKPENVIEMINLVRSAS